MIAEITRKTKETDITAKLNLYGSGKYNIDTGIGFFDHMLELFACHGGFDLDIKCMGDLKVDGHHSVEDVGIVLGKLINMALGDKKGIKRYADKKIPMDEALAECVLDISGRSYLIFNADLTSKAGDFDLELVEEFFRAVATNGMFTLHLSLLYGTNNHHKAEALFKVFARTLKSAIRIVSDEIPSSKGVI